MTVPYEARRREAGNVFVIHVHSFDLSFSDKMVRLLCTLSLIAHSTNSHTNKSS